MTNLTSEQYRDILHNVEGSTEKTPNILNLLRAAVETFYTSYGCYPDVASASPGSATLFGEQTQFDDGLALTLPTPMATVIVGKKVPGCRISIATSADVGKPHKLSFGFYKCLLMAGEPTWLNYMKCVIEGYCCKGTITAFQAAIESSIPLGVGLGSAAALEVAFFTFLEIMFGGNVHPINKGVACRCAEENFLQKSFVGPVARICASTAKDRHASIIDNMITKVDFIPFKHDEVFLIAIDTHLKDIFLEYEYSDRTKCLRKACDILGVENLRQVTEEELDLLEERINMDIKIYNGMQQTQGVSLERMLLVSDEWPEDKLLEMVSRARFYVSEMKRIEEATEAWNDGDVVKFGEKLTESHLSLKMYYGFSHPVLDFFVETSLQADGVLGSKMIGLGLGNGGCVCTLIYKKNLREFSEFLMKSFEEHKAELLDKLKEKLTQASKEPGEVDLGGQEGGNHDRKPSQEKRRESRLEAAEEVAEVSSTGQRTDVVLKSPTLYIINPIAGARMFFPLKTDLLRSRFARRIPQPKELVRKAMAELYENYAREPEAIGLAPATTTLFGEFLEYTMGYVISMALPLLTVTLGCRNDSATFSMKTTSNDVGNRTEFRAPVPSCGSLELQMESWINYAVGTTAEFNAHVPGFTSVVESAVPCQVGIHSCAAFQGSIYQFLEGLSRTCIDNPIEKAERCRRAEDRFGLDNIFPQSKCSVLRFLPTFTCKEGYVLLINTKNEKMAHYYLDHPSYAFLLACCREKSSDITPEEIMKRMRICQEAAELLGKDSLVNADERHIRCLRKRGAPEEMVKRAQYVMSEQQRCVKAIEAIKQDNFERLGVLMTESHVSLRDDFEVSTSEIEVIVNLALSVDGVLGAKLVGKGYSSTVLILSRLSSVDSCIRHVRKNYMPKRDKPYFYVFRPSTGAYTMNVDEVTLIP